MERELDHGAALVAQLRQRPRKEGISVGAALVALIATRRLLRLPRRRRTILCIGVPALVERRTLMLPATHRSALHVDADAARERLRRVDELTHRDALERVDEAGRE